MMTTYTLPWLFGIALVAGCYGALVAWGRQLGEGGSVTLLEKTLEEEKATDRRLTEIAEARVNRVAA